MIDSIKKKENVELVPNTSIKSISGTNYLIKITLLDSSGVEKTVNIDGLFNEMGSKINLDFVKHLVKLDT